MKQPYLLLLVVLVACSSSEDKASDQGASGRMSSAGKSSAGHNSAGTNSPEEGGDGGDAPTSGGAAHAGSGGGGKPPGTGGAVTAPQTKWINVTSNLRELGGDTAGEVTVLSAEPGTKRVIAGLSRTGLFVTEDNGTSWNRLGTGPGSAPMNHIPTAIVYDPEHAGVFWETGIYGDGVFKTTDDGVTFERLGDQSHNDSISVDFTDPERKVLVVGPHEAAQKLFRSTDGGETWSDIGATLPAGSSFSTLPYVLDANTFLVGSAGYSGTWGVFRTTDAGQTWTSVSTEGPAGEPTITSSGSIYWALANNGVIVSDDQGKSWTKGGAGPVTPFANGLVELPDGRIVALGSTHLLASADEGKTWQEVGEALPYPGGNCQTYGFTYSAATKAFFIMHNDCSGMLIPETVWMSGFDWEKP